MLLYDMLFLLYLIVECSCFTKLGNRNDASPVLLCVYFCLRRATKETLVETSSSITESLMSISRMMAEQVNQSEDTIGTLGKKTLFFNAFVSFCQLVQCFPVKILIVSTKTFHLQCPSPISSPQPPPPGRCRKPTRSSETWQEPSTWGGSSSSSTTGGSWRTSCSSSWLWPSSSPPSSTSLRSVSSLLFS